MDSFSHKLTFKYTLSDVSVENQSKDWQMLLRICGNFFINVNDRVFYKERNFPVVEFAHQLIEWMEYPQRNFEYNSMESDIGPLITFVKRHESFLLYSLHQEYEEKSVFSYKEIQNAAGVFIANLNSELVNQFHIDASRLLIGT